MAILVALELAIDFVGDEPDILAPWFVGVAYGLMLVAVWAFGVRKYRARWKTLGLVRPVARWSFVLPGVALVGSLAFAVVYTAIITALGVDVLQPQSLPDDVLGQGFTRLASTLVIVLWGPFAEEVFFRGFFLAALLPSLGAVRAAVVSSAVFAVAHVSPSTMIPVFVTGLLLSWLYIKTRSIWPPITAHVAQNLIVVSAAS